MMGSWLAKELSLDRILLQDGNAFPKNSAVAGLQHMYMLHSIGGVRRPWIKCMDGRDCHG